MGCTAIIINTARGPIIAKNSDTTWTSAELPFTEKRKQITLNYSTGSLMASKTIQTYAFTGGYAGFNAKTGLTRSCFGVNEKGLAAVYTQLEKNILNPTPNPSGLMLWGRDLTSLFLACYEDVGSILRDLQNPSHFMGPNNRNNNDCIGVVDANGDAAVVEVGSNRIVYHRVEEPYYCWDNRNRLFELNQGVEASVIRPLAESGQRTVLIDAAYRQQPAWTAQDVASRLMRFVRGKESGSVNYSIDVSGDWDITNDGTNSSMVCQPNQADPRLSVLWGEYGSPPMLGVYLPQLALGSVDVQPDVKGYVEGIVRPACMAGGLYVPAKVRAVQERAAAAEDYCFRRWAEVDVSGLTDAMVQSRLSMYLADAIPTGFKIYREGVVSPPPPPPPVVPPVVEGFKWLPVFVLDTLIFILARDAKKDG